MVVINEALLKSPIFTSGWYFFRILIRDLITERYLILNIKKLQKYLLPSTEKDGLNAMRVRIDSRKFLRHVDKISQIIRISTNTSTYRNFVIFNLFIGEIPYIVTYLL